MNQAENVAAVERLAAYEVIESRPIKDINSMSMLLRHKKTGAKVALLLNDDENKVFYIGFRTPPFNSTGVPHILEHSVLCGSKEFPVKDPFVELVKGSLNTFLNAMTYPDKTLYPVASCNDQDFQNLMHVYLDAVFYPNIYGKEEIFRQEGWHYEMEGEDAPLTINGVVYNEMKGAYSSADDVLETAVMNALYPHTAYGVDSGGNPDVIPELTYEEFLNFHRRYYHPSNSYIYLYGDMDMAEKLDFIDKHYLGGFDALAVDSAVEAEADTDRRSAAPIVKEYPLNEGESAEENTYLTVNYAVGDSTDNELCMAFQILDYALCSAPGAPLKQALVDRGIGKDVYSIFDDGIRQPYFGVVAKGTTTDKLDLFLSTVREVLAGIAADGMDEKALLAALNYYEFKYREADFGSYPKGLMYGLQMLDSWLYDEHKPFVHIEMLAVFEKLRSKVGSDYYVELIRRWLLENTHYSVVVLKPVEGLLEKQEAALAERLARKKAAMSPEEKQEIFTMMDRLEAFRETEDAPEDLAKIPLLKREDLKKEASLPVYEERMLGETRLIYHNLFTIGIGYLRLIFSVDDIPEEYFGYIAILKGCLGLLNTASHSYGDLFNEMNLVTGGMAAVNNVYSEVKDANRCKVTLELKTKAFYDNLGKAVELMQEVMLTSDFTDAKRLKEILSEAKSRMQAQMMSGGHSVAAGRALSYGSVSGALSEVLSGVPFYRLVARYEEQFDTLQGALADKLVQLAKMIFRPENLLVDFVGDEQALAPLAQAVASMRAQLYTEPVQKASYRPVPVRQNEGFMTAGQIQYVCRAGNFRKQGLAYTGALRVLKVMLGYEYLWMNVRVKGGAYGCMCKFGRTGESYFVSYRDPNLQKTLDVFEAAADTIASYEADERTMTQYIIGAVSDIDVPMTPATKGLFGLNAYMTGLDDAWIQKEREEVLTATAEDIRSLAAHVRAFMQDDQLCVVGNAVRLKQDEKIFAKLENLFA